MADKQNGSVSRTQSYLRAWQKRGANASEGDLYDVFAMHIMRGILGYEPDEYNITPRGKRGTGAPDLRLKTSDGVAWVAVEAKTDDNLIRNAASRARLWSDKRKYVDDQTAYFLWVAPHTFLLCDAAGKELSGVRLEAGQEELHLDLGDNVWHTTIRDEDVAECLSPISADAGRAGKYLERFRAGELPYGHIKVTGETIDLLTRSLSNCANILLTYLVRSLLELKDDYAKYEKQRVKYEQDLHKNLWGEEEERKHRIEIALRAFDRKHDRAVAYHRAFVDFCTEQAYTKYEKERNENERAALERIFRANAAYVAIGRLLFVRLAEDQALIKPKISNGGLEAWNKVLGNGGLVAQWVGLAYSDARRVCEQLFAETPFDVLMPKDDPVFDEALLQVLYRLNAFDLSGLTRDVDVLGQIYQGILDRKLRKDLGEFYTDQEVVEYILARIGLKEEAETGAQVRVLDPACGSGAFLVRAAGILREADAKRHLPKEDVQERISTAIHGLDINHFAVYIADMNLLFATFDLTAATKHPARFSVHRINSLLKSIFSPAGIAPDGEDAYQAALESREAQYDFLVGNPPYVRAERLPDEDRTQLKRLYEDMHGEGNVDLAVYFVRRALQWLAPGGRMGLILPRSMADAAFSARLRSLLQHEDYTLEELVPLDWAAHELFDSDVVPFLLFLRKSPRPVDHRVALVQGLRSKADILARAKGQAPAGTRTSRVPWDDFARHSEAGWPLELTTEDVAILDVLRKCPRLASEADSRSAIKAGSTGAASEGMGTHAADRAHLPMVTGSEVHAYWVEAPRRSVLIKKADDPSIWSPLARDEDAASLPPWIVTVAKIHVTLNAVVVAPVSLCCQDSTVLLIPKESSSVSAHAICALVNSRAARYSVFMTGRAGVAGGGRRDFTIYPRTLSAIPIPVLSDGRWKRLDRLSRIAHAKGAERAQTDVNIWNTVSRDHSESLIREWPLDFGGWPDGRVLTASDFDPRMDGETLQLAPDLFITGASHLLNYILNHLNAYFDGAEELEKGAFMRHKVASTDSVAGILTTFANAYEERTTAEKDYWRAIRLIDDIVEKGLGLSPKLRERLDRRMNEFPLNENANRPRLPWEGTKKPRGRKFVAGARYH